MLYMMPLLQTTYISHPPHDWKLPSRLPHLFLHFVGSTVLVVVEVVVEVVVV